MTSSGSTSARSAWSSPIKPSKQAVRRIRKRLRDEPRSLRGGNAQAVPQTGEPDHPRSGPPTTGHRSPARHSRRWIPICGGSPSGGPRSATRPSRRTGSSPGTSASSTRLCRTGGCSVTAQAAPTCTSSPGPTLSDTRSSDTGPHPMTPNSLTTGPGDGAKAPLPINRTALWLHREPKTDAARSARAPWSPTRTGHKTHISGSTWLATARKTIDVIWAPPRHGQG